MSALGEYATANTLMCDTLKYVTLDPPVSGSAQNLEQTLNNGNTTTLPIDFVQNVQIVRGFKNGNINVGYVAGSISSTESVNIGTNLGGGSGDDCVNIGIGCGSSNQSNGCVSIGQNAGVNDQGFHSIAIGYDAGTDAAGFDSICIGDTAGLQSCGQNSICIGKGAGSFSAMPQNSICLNSSGLLLTNPATDSFCVSSIRGGTNPAGGVANTLWYDTTTKEIKYHIP